MRIDTKNGLTRYRFENLSGYRQVFHGFFTRSGGSSSEPFNSLNVGLGLGDDTRRVAENRERVARFFGLGRLHFSQQVHGIEIWIDPGPNTASKGRRPGIPTGDAMVTNRLGRALAIQVADCQAVLLFDTRKNIVANIHSGWRGSIRNIVGRTVAEMNKRFSCRSDDLVAGISPSLGPCCAEFVNYKREIPKRFWKYGDGNRRFDFWALTRDQLLHAGVRKDRIETGGLCTRCRKNLFFSYRGEGVTGRTAAVIGLKPG